jgi:hypothetical protein
MPSATAVEMPFKIVLGIGIPQVMRMGISFRIVVAQSSIAVLLA